MSKAARVPTAEKAFGGIEMRTAPRYLILQRCFVHPTKSASPDAWRSVAYNISVSGLGITLPSKLPVGTLITIHAHGLPRSSPLEARVVRSKQVEFSWLTNCELTKRMSDAELRIWRSGPTDWVDSGK